MSSSLPKFLETGINVFISNSQIITIKTYYEKSTIYKCGERYVSMSVCDVFINFLLIDATDRSKISSDQKRLFSALSLYPLSFFANTPCNNCL